jgi:hypothetical protein
MVIHDRLIRAAMGSHISQVMYAVDPKLNQSVLSTSLLVLGV